MEPSGSDTGAGDMAAVGATSAPTAAPGPEPSELAEREREIRETQDDLRERQADLEGRQDALERREADLEQRVEEIAEREPETGARTGAVDDAVPAPGVGRFEGEGDRDAPVGARSDDADREMVGASGGSTGRLRRFGES